MTAQKTTSFHFSIVHLIQHALKGAALAFILLVILVLILIMISGLRIQFDPLMIVPFLTVSTAGAWGGTFYYLTGYFRNQGGWQKATVIVLNILVYIVSLWLGLIAGLNVTGHWD